MKISAILTDKEKVALYEFNLKNAEKQLLLPVTLCPVSNARVFHQLKFEPKSIHSTQVQTLVPEHLIINDVDSITSDMRFRTTQIVVNIFQFIPAVDLHLTGFTMLGRIPDRPSIKKLTLETSSVYVDLPQKAKYNSQLSVCIVKPTRHEQKFEGDHDFSSPDSLYEFSKPVFIPKGSKVHINFTCHPDEETSVYRNICQRPIMEFLKEAANSDVFESIALQTGLNSPIFLRSISYISRK